MNKFSELNKKYTIMNSKNLHKEIIDDPTEWYEYHKLKEESEQGFIEQDEIPYKRIIRYLENNIPKRKKYVADLGCGLAKIHDYFKNNKIYEFYNYDHESCNEYVRRADISELPLKDGDIDIAIMSLCMMGSNCKDYIKECNRVLDHNGILLIIEPSKRWVDDNGNNRLENMIIDNGFTIKKYYNKDKFMFIEFVKI